MTSRRRELVIRPGVLLPALSTDITERECSHLQFLDEWVVGAPMLKEQDNLDHLFAWEDALEALRSTVKIREGLFEPELPNPPHAPPEGAVPAEKRAWEEETRSVVEAHVAAVRAYHSALGKASEGETLWIPDDAFAKGIKASKAMIDARTTPDERGNRYPEPWARKILRLFHATSLAPLK